MNFFPIFTGETFPYEVAFIPAIVVGFLFGFALERNGFGDARILAAQFYLNNMRVFKVMFSGIVTAAVGLAFFSAVGLLDMGALFIPETYIWPHLTGGLLLGAGFIVSGYCPGTSIVAMASGKWDGLMTVFGVVVGSVVFGEMYPTLAEFHVSSALGVFTLDQWLGIGLPVVVTVVAVAAALMFFGAEKVEAIFSPRGKKEKEATWNRRTVGLLAGFAATGVAAIVVTAVLPEEPVKKGPVVAEMDVLNVARMLVEEPRSLYVVDLRPKPACSEGKERLPYALCFADVAAELDLFPGGRTLLLYGQGELVDGELPPGLDVYGGRTAVLAGGYDAWASLIVEKTPAEELLAALSPPEKALVPALHSYFTGANVKIAPAAPRPKVKRKIKKGGGCS